MNTFTLGDSCEIFLYGAASIGKIVYNHLYDANITITGFIDKRAGEIDVFMGLPVFHIEEVSEKKEAIVIVSVKNVFEHSEIINSFISRGIKKLIYMPKAILEGEEDAEKQIIADTYNSLIDGIVDFSRDIPYSYESEVTMIKESGIVDVSKSRYVVLLPATMLFTNNYNVEEHKWGNTNVLAFFTHISFFRYLMGESGYGIDDYLTHYCEYTAKIQGDIQITEGWKRNVIKNRSMIFNKMNSSYYFDKSFFVRNAATAEYNYEKGYFNLTSGKHRTMFLIAKRNEYVPVSISKKDYEYYRNEYVAKEYDMYLKNKNIQYVDSIANPFFYEYPTRDYGFGFSVISGLTYYFSKELFEKYACVDFSRIRLVCNGGSLSFITRHFLRMGVDFDWDEMDEEQRLIVDLERIHTYKDGNSSESVLLIDDDLKINKIYDYVVTTTEHEMMDYVKDLSFEGIYGERKRKMWVYRRV